MAGIHQHRGRHLELGFGECCLVAGEGGNDVVGRIEAVGIDAAEIRSRRLGALVLDTVVDPHRRVGARLIVGLDGRLVFAVQNAVTLGADELLDFLGDSLIER